MGLITFVFQQAGISPEKCQTEVGLA